MTWWQETRYKRPLNPRQALHFFECLALDIRYGLRGLTPTIGVLASQFLPPTSSPFDHPVRVECERHAGLPVLYSSAWA